MPMPVSHAHALNYDDLDEAELVALARAGRREACRVIVQRCNQRLFRVARAVVRDDAEAEDVVQAAYLQGFAKLDSFRGKAGLLTWLTRITLNEARGRLRRRRPTVELEAVETAQRQGAEIVSLSAARPESPESEAARAQIRRLIERAVDDLPEPFRVVFVMREVEECTVEETAANLDLKPETVKTRLHRARRMLRAALDEQLSATTSSAFPFLGTRCERMTAAVLARLPAQPED
ncbi:RNA polymerase sigma factor [Caulobacter sp. 17J80-11]|uniref:RNA polymerase sigma factor n=1 Tax=Caulobacter sp. 17J80-11 TaxID=2763502 RepID=UPI001CA390A4|nr:RNA polymerase sigma factor [Caulobacter sp. 17J80-11]